MVTYHVGESSVEHISYMRVLLGPHGNNQYPGFNADPLNAFRGLANDLGRFCSVFLSGSDSEFEVIASEVAADSKVKGAKRLP